MKETEIREEEQEKVNGGFVPPEILTLENSAAEGLAEDLAANSLEIETTKCQKIIEIKKKRTVKCADVRR